MSLMHRALPALLFSCLLLPASGCSGDSQPSAAAGGESAGGVVSTSSGGAPVTEGGTTGATSGGQAGTTGGATGGSSTGGATGGSSTGGATGGSSTGGASGGASGMGPASTGGTAGSGGVPSGGSAAGGASGGGAPAGGASAAGGAGADAGGGSGGTTAQAGGGSGGVVDQGALPNITLHLAGDSTVMTYDAGSAQEGWGQELGQFFIDKLKVNNQAIGGASVRTFQTGRWTNIVSALKAGDYVMIQFGTNDSGTVQGRHVDVPDFSTALGEMIDDVEGKQGTVILVTPSALQEWSGGMEGNSRLGPYAQAMRDLGPMRGVLVDDLNARGVEYLNEIGQTAAMQIYIDGDKAHFTKMGATQMAQFVAQELERIQSPLAAYLAP